MIESLEKRPILVLFLGLLIGCSCRVAPWCGLLAAAAILLAQSPARWLLGGSFVVGLLIGPQPGSDFEPVERFWEGTGVLVGVPRLTGTVQTALMNTDSGRYVLRVRGDEDLSLGDRVAFRAFASPPSEAGEDYYRRLGARGVVEPLNERVEVLGQGPQVFRWGLAWRRAFVATVDRSMEPMTADWMKALCFNVRGGLDDATSDQLSRTGTAHIVSASGLHVLILAFGLHGLLGLLPMPRPAQVLLLILVLLVYAGAAGLRPPVLRAVAMGSLFFSAYLFRREPDGLSAMGLAGCFELLWSPRSILDVGFQLSYLTAAALSLYLNLSPDRPRTVADQVRTYFVNLGTVSLVAFVASAPLVAYHFGIVSLSSIGTNLLVVPAVFVVVLVGMLALPMTLALPETAGLFYGGVVQPLVGWVTLVIEGVAQWPLSAVYVPPVPQWAVATCYAGLLLAWRPHRRKAPPDPPGILP